VLFDEMPQTLEVVELGGMFRGGYEVVVDDHHFWLRRDPEKLTERLERWFRFFFNDFEPQVANTYRWRSPGTTARLRALESVPCPECARRVLPRVGQVGDTFEAGERPPPAR
jgi:hypothetical protein